MDIVLKWSSVFRLEFCDIPVMKNATVVVIRIYHRKYICFRVSFTGDTFLRFFGVQSMAEYISAISVSTSSYIDEIGCWII